MIRLRWAVPLAGFAALAGVLAALSVADPFHLRNARWFTAGLVLAVLVLLTAAATVLARPGLLRVLTVVVGAIAVVGWMLVVLLATRLEADNKVLSEVAEGNRRLMVVEAAPVLAGPVYAVVVRAGSGPFEQESLVYQGRENMPAPTEVRFVDPDNVEVRLGAACRYRSAIEPGTLAVDPVHRPLRAGMC